MEAPEQPLCVPHETVQQSPPNPRYEAHVQSCPKIPVRQTIHIGTVTLCTILLSVAAVNLNTPHGYEDCTSTPITGIRKKRASPYSPQPTSRILSSSTLNGTTEDSHDG